MKLKKMAVLTIVASTMLAGCSTSYRETLEQKLSDKPDDQKRAVLAQECGNELKAGLKKDNPANVRHIENMRKICEEMTKKKVVVE